MALVLVLLIIAAVCSGLQSFGVNGPVHLGWAGVCLLAVALAFQAGLA